MNHTDQGENVNRSEHPAKTPSTKTGFLATLAALSRAKGTPAPSLPGKLPAWAEGAPGQAGQGRRKADKGSAHQCVTRRRPTEDTGKRRARRDYGARAFASSATVGLALLFIALAAPSAQAAPPEEPKTEPAVAITATTAVLTGTLNPAAPGEPESTFQFLYKPSSTATKAECESGASKAPEPPALAGGGQAEPVGVQLEGLTPNTHYIACLLATNLAATESSLGEVISFKTALPPEVPLIEAPSEVKGTSATLHGVLNPNAPGDPGSYEFFYRADPAECQGEFGTPNTPSAGAEGEEVQAEVTLIGSTTYSFCLYAINGSGEAALSATETFTTPAAAPAVFSQTATAITPFAASLQAEVNPENETATSCFFEYGKVAPTDNKVPCEQLEFTGSANQIASRNLSGLSPGSTYLFRVAIANGTGETTGETAEFQTPPAQAPSIVSESAGAITPTSARLEGVLDPHSQLTHCSFTYGLVVSENKVPCEPEFLEGSGEQGVGFNLGGLTPGTTYHFLILAKNATGETEGSETEFTTLALEAPIISAAYVTALTNISASLEGQINPDSQETTYEFEYATDEAFTQEVETVEGPSPLPPVYENLATGPVALGQLKPETTYYYRLVATNGTDTSESAPQSFTTNPAEAPVIESASATKVTETGATFQAKINPKGYASTYSFQYATDEAFTQNVGSVPGTAPLPAGSVGVLTGPVLLKNGLAPETVYYYRAIATNPVMGTTTGLTQQLKTLGKAVVSTGAATEVTRNSAGLSGTVNPKGAQTTYRFLYVAANKYQPGAGECPAGNGCAYAQGQSTAPRSLSSIAYSPEAVGPIPVQELAPATTYHYALVATSQTGTTVGADQTFTTAAASSPSATTGAASGIGPNSATITGSVDTAGLPTTTRFEIATAPTEPGQGATQAAQVVSQNGNTATIQASFGQTLAPNTTYYYRAAATNPDGTSYGAERSFTTAGAAIAPAPEQESPPSLAPKKCGKGKVRKHGKCVKKSKKNSKKRANDNRGGSK